MLRRAEGILLRLTTVHYRQSESQKHQLGFWKNSCTLGPMPRTGRIYLSQSVSFPPELLAAAKRRAANLGLSFSTYVQKCIERDLSERKAIVFDETPAARLVAEDPAPDPARRRRAR
jgi:hypothetical protein